MEGSGPTRNFYDYNPSKPFAYVFAVLYTIPAIYTLYQYITLKCWFWIFMVIASMMEAIGYIFRAISVNQPSVLSTFLVQFMCIFLAPAIIAASCYMAMGRVILHVTPLKYQTISKLWIPTRWLTPIFVGCDVIAFAIQMLGASQVGSNNPNTIKTAFMVMKIGLGVQLFCFALFIVVAARFYFVSRTFRAYWPDERWTRFAMAVYVSSILIFVRSIYRMLEFTQGAHGFLLTHEWTFYVFEALLMLPIIIMFNVFHPSKYVNNTGFRQKRSAENIPSDTESVVDVALDQRPKVTSQRS